MRKLCAPTNAPSRVLEQPRSCRAAVILRYDCQVQTIFATDLLSCIVGRPWVLTERDFVVSLRSKTKLCLQDICNTSTKAFVFYKDAPRVLVLYRNECFLVQHIARNITATSLCKNSNFRCSINLIADHRHSHHLDPI